MALEAIDQANVAQRIADELREAIQSGDLKPGDRLVERTLAQRLGVSHIPLREAIARLAEEGLVDRTPRRVARVAALTARELEEISSLRIVLESFVGRRVQARWSPETERELRAIVDGMGAAASENDVDRLSILDREFHETLWRMADHRELTNVTAQLRRRLDSLLRAANQALDVGELQRHASAHGSLIDALASGSPSISDAAIEAHVREGVARVSAHASALKTDAKH